MTATSTDQPTSRYTFAPLERRGVLLGLDASTLAGAGTGAAVAIGVLSAFPGALGAAAAIVIFTAGIVGSCWPVAGRPPIAWAPVVLGWARRRGLRLDAAPLVGTSGSDPGPRVVPPVGLAATAPPRFGPPAGSAATSPGSAIGLPAASRRGRSRAAVSAPATGTPAGSSPVQPRAAVSGSLGGRPVVPALGRARAGGVAAAGRRSTRGPAAAHRGHHLDPAATTGPVGMRLVEAPALPGEGALGVLEDRVARTWGAVIPVRGPSLGLLGGAEQARQVAGWGAVLAGLARDGTAVHRLQWVERCMPADPTPLLRAASGAPGPQAACSSYLELVGAEAPGTLEHRAFLVVSVRGRRSAPRRRSAGASLTELLRREVRLARGQLRGADLEAGAALGLAELGSVLRAANDPCRPPASASSATGAAGVWPAAIDEGWGVVRVDDTWQATYWVAEWPRLPVGADFLGPVLLGAVARTVAVTMAPVPSERAVRQVQSARTAGIADDALRARAGFVATARREREAEGVRRREVELADGHVDYRYSGYVTVSGSTRAQLEAACAEAEQAARQSHLVLRRLYGRQAEARTWTLPLARGLT